MSNKKEEIVDRFLETHNMDYLFCILAEKEADRLASLPDSIKRGFSEKITSMSLKHIALNDVPDYIIDEIDNPTKNEDNYYNDEEYKEEYEDDFHYTTTHDNLDDYDDNDDNIDDEGSDIDDDDDEDDYGYVQDKYVDDLPYNDLDD